MQQCCAEISNVSQAISNKTNHSQEIRSNIKNSQAKLVKFAETFVQTKPKINLIIRQTFLVYPTVLCPPFEMNVNKNNSSFEFSFQFTSFQSR